MAKKAQPIIPTKPIETAKDRRDYANKMAGWPVKASK